MLAPRSLSDVGSSWHQPPGSYLSAASRRCAHIFAHIDALCPDLTTSPDATVPQHNQPLDADIYAEVAPLAVAHQAEMAELLAAVEAAPRGGAKKAAREAVK